MVVVVCLEGSYEEDESDLTSFSILTGLCNTQL